MAITAATHQFLNQQALLRFIDPSGGPEGPNGTKAFWLVPTNGYFNGQRAPHSVQEELDGGSFDKQTIEGIEYFLVPEESTNTPGRLSHYAQLTGVAELHNPSGGGVNRVRETLANYAKATVAPDAVEKYVADNDSYEEARKKASEQDEVTSRAVDASTPAREPAEGKLVSLDDDSSKSSVKESKAAPAKPAGPKNS